MATEKAFPRFRVQGVKENLATHVQKKQLERSGENQESVLLEGFIWKPNEDCLKGERMTDRVRCYP